jgi:ATP adenylyltransferase
MERIWSPWRMDYIQQHTDTSGCIFCLALEQNDGTNNLILHRSSKAFVILNRYPYTSGHLMVVPFAHQPSLELLDTETRYDMMDMVAKAIKVIRYVYQPDGLNLGANIGEVAGAGVAEHVHIHLVPRWAGDTNFMSTVAGARVLPEDLNQTYQRLFEGWKKIS